MHCTTLLTYFRQFNIVLKFLLSTLTSVKGYEAQTITRLT